LDDETRAALAEQDAEDRELERRKREAEPVLCRVLPMGHKKVHKGEDSPLTGRPVVFLKGEQFMVGRGIARVLEGKGYVEIMPTPAPAVVAPVAPPPAADPAPAPVTAKAK
jgi:hypothetical protein